MSKARVCAVAVLALAAALAIVALAGYARGFFSIGGEWILAGAAAAAVVYLGTEWGEKKDENV